jgi:predicted nucleic acid-binding protein
VSVLDTSAAIDFLLGGDTAGAISAELNKGPAAAPDLLVFEVLAVLRRGVLRGALGADRARVALADLGDIAVELFPTLSLRERAWELRENLTAADALFVALAERLGEPLLTRDQALAAAAGRHAGVETIALG